MDGLLLGEANRVLSKQEYALYYSSIQPNLEEISIRELESKLVRIENHLSKLEGNSLYSKRLEFLKEAKQKVKELLKELRNSPK